MKHTNRGVTLPELLVTLSVGAVLIAAAVPSFSSFVANSRMSTTANLFVSHVNTARSEAVTRGEPVAICASADQSTCSDSADWGAGWIIFTDASGQPGALDDEDELLLVGMPPDESLSLSSDQAYLRYNALGMLASG